jgi:hypothetical protein
LRGFRLFCGISLAVATSPPPTILRYVPSVCASCDVDFGGEELDFNYLLDELDLGVFQMWFVKLGNVALCWLYLHGAQLYRIVRYP